MRFVIQIEGIVISVRPGRHASLVAENRVSPGSSSSSSSRNRLRRRAASLRAVRVIERVVDDVGRLHTEVRRSRIVPQRGAADANRAAIS